MLVRYAQLSRKQKALSFVSTQSWRKTPSPFHEEITCSFTVFPCEWRAFTLLSHVHKLCETVKPVKHG